MELGYTTVTKVAVARIMVKFQARPSETLNMFEFVKLAEYINSYQKVDASIRAAFEKYDADGSGDIDLNELSAALRHVGHEVTQEQAVKSLRAYVPGTATTLNIFEFGKLAADLTEHIQSQKRKVPDGW